MAKQAKKTKQDILVELPPIYSKLYNQKISFTIEGKTLNPVIDVRVNNLTKKPPLYLKEIVYGSFNYISSLYPLEQSSTNNQFRFDYKLGDSSARLYILEYKDNKLSVREGDK